jgi:hypothetical protein
MMVVAGGADRSLCNDAQVPGVSRTVVVPDLMTDSMLMRISRVLMLDTMCNREHLHGERRWQCQNRRQLAERGGS